MVFFREPSGEGFGILKHEVSNKQWLEFLDYTAHPPPLCDFDMEGAAAYHQRHAWRGRAYPPGGGGLPVTFISKADAEAFCQWRTERTGFLHRLPTDEEWTTAAGSTRYPWGDSVSELHPVPLGRSFEVGPDPCYASTDDQTADGVRFMLGNVREYTSTLEAGFVVLRGGAFDSPMTTASLQMRRLAKPDHVSYSVGFRYVVPMDAKGELIKIEGE